MFLYWYLVSVFLISVFLTQHFTSITHSKETMSKFQLFKLSTMTFPFKILHVFLLAKKVINSCLADDGILFNQIWSSEININRWVHQKSLEYFQRWKLHFFKPFYHDENQRLAQRLCRDPMVHGLYYYEGMNKKLQRQPKCAYGGEKKKASSLCCLISLCCLFVAQIENECCFQNNVSSSLAQKCYHLQKVTLSFTENILFVS